jgi:hypothetical protein
MRRFFLLVALAACANGSNGGSNGTNGASGSSIGSTGLSGGGNGSGNNGATGGSTGGTFTCTPFSSWCDGNMLMNCTKSGADATGWDCTKQNGSGLTWT